MALRGVLFDMGGTLLDYHPPDADPTTGWQQMENTGARAMHAFLAAEGYRLPPVDEAQQANFTIMEHHWRRMGSGEPVNPQLALMIREVLGVWGITPEVLNNGLVGAAMAAYVAPVQAYVRPLEGAQQTLEGVRALGLRIGLISNTVWPGEFHLEDLERWGLRQYLECAFFSADEDAWKPSAAVFQLGLDALGLRPEEAVYVGDHPYFDVNGAQQAGLRGVWMKSDEWSAQRFEGVSIMPDAVLHRLPELLTVIKPWLESPVNF